MAHNGFKDLLHNGGFQAFLWTQFLGAFNDQLYWITVTLCAVEKGFSVGLVQAVYLLPFLLFSGYSGHLADAVSKRRVLVGVKVFEIAAMALGVLALASGRMDFMLAVLFLMGTHSTMFSPAKYGIVPEMLPDRDLSRGNALLEMTTFVAIVGGTAVAAVLAARWKADLGRMGWLTAAVAAAGFLASLRIPRVPPSGAKARFRWNPYAEVAEGTKHLLADRPLWLAVLAIAYFWSLGSLFKQDLILFGGEALQTGVAGSGLLAAFLGLGVGAGNLLAGRLSGDKVELGLVPLGALLMAAVTLGLSACGRSYALAAAGIVALGVSSGLFIVPLYAYLQQRSGAEEKGRIVATNNFYQTVGMLLAALALWAGHDVAHIGADRILLACGVATLLATFYIVTVVPDYLLRFVVWMLAHTLYRIRIVGQEKVPFRGPALLVSNHVSLVDGFLISACVQRFIRFLVWRPYYESRILNPFFRLAKAIPVGGGRRDAVESIRAAREQLAAGHVVAIFAEGAISRTGNLLPFKRGMERIVEGLDVPIIPVHLDRVWGSVFSFEGGRFFWKWPKRLPYPVTVSFGRRRPATAAAHEVRLAIQELSAEAAVYRKSAGDLLDRRLIRSARRHWRRFAMADSTGRELTYGRMLAGGMVISQWVRRHSAEGERIGVVLPPACGAALANIGITLAGRIPVNLNFTAGGEAMASAREQCGIRTVVTSHAFVAKGKVEALEGMVFLEDILAGAGKWARLRALAAARLAPAALLSRGRRTPDSLATVIFSSGSTGVPKGVMLSHYNVIANIEAMAQLYDLRPDDRVLGALPLFHSFGFTVTLWMPPVAGCGAVYHANPTDAKVIGQMAAKYGATLMVAAPSFYAGYTRKCAPGDFATLRCALSGAEQLRESVAAAFREKFGKEIREGYGCTEMSPVVAGHGPDFSGGENRQIGHKPGTVGQPLPGVAAKVVDPATFEALPPGREGLLLVKGANRMLGYLGQPEATAAVFRDGWYITGDIAGIDDDGFLRITDRLSRFSKIAGEMVPHIRIEDAIRAVLGEVPCAVTAVPDDGRGERLVAFYCSAEIGPAELWQRLSRTELPRLWLPKRESLYQVAALPQTGSGKLDLRGLKALAQAMAAVMA